MLCSLVRAEPQKGRIFGTISGWLTAHWNVCPAPIDQPVTQASRSMPNCSVTRRYCASTLSRTVTCGKRARSYGGGVLLGELDNPLPSMFGMMMNQRAASSARPEPRSHSFSQCRPEYHVG